MTTMISDAVSQPGVAAGVPSAHPRNHLAPPLTYIESLTASTSWGARLKIRSDLTVAAL